MSQKILQVNFKLNASTTEYQDVCRSLADAFANVPGLRWKVWILNESKEEAGGIYLFETPQALENFLSGPLAAGVRSHPGLRDVSMKSFDVMEDVTAITRGPVAVAAAAD